MDEQQAMQAPPPEVAAPTPEQAMDSMEQERIAQIEAVAAASPALDKPMQASLVSKLVKEVNKLIGLIDDSMTEVEYEAEEKKIMDKFPPEVFVPIVIIFSFVSTLGEGFQKYMMDPAELGSEAGVRKAMAMLKKMAKDKQLLERMQEPIAEEPEEEEVDMEAMPTQPSEMDEDDQAVMGMM